MFKKRKHRQFTVRKLTIGVVSFGAAFCIISTSLSIQDWNLNQNRIVVAKELAKTPITLKDYHLLENENILLQPTSIEPNSTKIIQNNVTKPVTKPIYEGDTQIIGKADPEVTICVSKGDLELGSITAKEDGTFSFELDESIKSGDIFYLYAENNHLQSVTTTLYPIKKSEKPISNERDAYTAYAVTLADKGLKFSEDGKRYFELKLSLMLASEAYLDLNKGKMYYMIGEKLAPYVESITFDRAAMSDGEAVKDSTEVSGANNIWSSGIITTNNGPVRAALLGASSSTYKITLKDDTPAELLNEPIPFTMWARYSSKTDMVEDFSKNLALHDNTSVTHGNSDFFSEKDIVGNDGPILDSAKVDYKNNKIDLMYRLNGSIFGNISNYNLHIKTESELINIIKSIKIGKYEYKLENGSLLLSPDKKEFIIKDIGGKNGFLSRLSNRQDFNVQILFKDGMSVKDALKSQNQVFNFSFKIYDNSSYEDAIRGISNVTDNIKNNSYISSNTLGTKTWNIQEFKENLISLVSQKLNNPHTYNDVPHSSDLIIPSDETDPYLAVFIASQSPTPINMWRAKKLVKETKKELLYKQSTGWFKDPARDDLNALLTAAEKVYYFVRTPFPENQEDFPGLLVRNTAADTFINAKDSDLDGVLDITEIQNSFGGNISDPDSDGDGISDGIELLSGTDPIITPFNWYDLNGQKIIIKTNTTSISGKLKNYSNVNEVVQPREIGLYKVESDGQYTLIAQTTSNTDKEGTFTIDNIKGLEKDDKVVIKITTKEIIGERSLLLQQGYNNPEISPEMKVLGENENVLPAPVDVIATTKEDNDGSKTTTVTGKSEPNSTITVKDKDDKTIGSGTADNDGSFTITTDQPIEPNTTITVTPEKDGITGPSASANVAGVKLSDSETTPSLPSFDPDGDDDNDGVKNGEELKHNSDPNDPSSKPLPKPTDITATTKEDKDGTKTTTVTGNSVSGSAITIKDKDGKIIGSGKTDENGSFTITTDQPVEPNTTVTVTPEKDGITGPIASANVTGVKLGDSETTTPPSELDLNADNDNDGVTNGEELKHNSDPNDPSSKPLPKPTDITATTKEDNDGSKTTTITGNSVSGSAITIKDKDGKTIGSVTADNDGSFTITTDQPVEPNTTVTVTPEKDGITGPSASANVTGVKLGDSEITPSLPSFDPDDDDDNDGISNGEELKHNSDPNDPSSKPLPKPTDVTATTKEDNDGSKTTTITGNSVSGSAITIKDKDGKTIGSGKANNDGSFTITTDQPVEPNTTITVTPEKDGITGPSASADVTGVKLGDSEITPSLPSFDPDDDDDNDGISNGEELKHNSDPNDPSSKPLPKPTDITATTKEDNDGSKTTTVTGKSEPNSTITVKDKDGKTIGSGKANNDGSFTITTDQPVEPNTTVTVTPEKDDITGPSASADVTGVKLGDDETTPTSPSFDPDGDDDNDGISNGEELKHNSDPNDPSSKPLPKPTDVTATTKEDNDGSKTTTVTGNSVSGSAITIKDKDGKTIGSGTADNDGSFTITTDQPVEPNTTVTVTPEKDDITGPSASADVTGVKLGDDETTPTSPSFDPDGDDDNDGISNGEELKHNSDPNDPSSKPLPKPTDVTATTKEDNDGSKTTTITGNSVSGSAITIKDKDGKTIGSGKANNDGSFTITTDQPVEPNTTITVTPEKDGITGPSASANVTGVKLGDSETTPTSPSFDPDGDDDNDGVKNGEELKHNSDPNDPSSKPLPKPTDITATTKEDNDGSKTTTITGNSVSGSAITIKDKDGKTIGSGKANNDGSFTITTDQPVEPNTTITVTPEKDGITGPSASADVTGVKLGDSETSPSLPSFDPDGDDDNDGISNGEELKHNSDPNDPSSKPLPKPTDVTATTKEDNDGSKTTTITGKSEPNSTITVKDKDGKTIGSGKANNDGSFTITTDQPVEPNTTVTVTPEKDGITGPSASANVAGVKLGDSETTTPPSELDLNADNDNDGVTNGEELKHNSDPNDPSSKPLPKPTDITATTKEDEDGTKTTTVTGNSVSGSAITIKDKDGKTIGSGTADNDGSFTITTDQPVEPNTTVTVTPEKDGITGPIASADVTGVKLGDSETTTPPSALDLNADNDNDGFTNGEELKYNSNPEDSSSKPLSALINVTATTKQNGDGSKTTIVTGKGEPDITIIVKDPNGKTIGSGVTNNEGYFTITTEQPIDAGKIITITQKKDTITGPDTAVKVSDYNQETSSSSSSSSSYTNNSEQSNSGSTSKDSENKPVSVPIDSKDSKDKPKATPIDSKDSKDKPKITPVDSKDSKDKPKITPVDSKDSKDKPKITPIDSKDSKDKPKITPVDSKDSKDKPKITPADSKNSKTKPELTDKNSINQENKNPQKQQSTDKEQTLFSDNDFGIPKTDDKIQISGFLGAMLLSILGILGINFNKKKEEYNEDESSL